MATPKVVKSFSNVIDIVYGLCRNMVDQCKDGESLEFLQGNQELTKLFFSTLTVILDIDDTVFTIYERSEGIGMCQLMEMQFGKDPRAAIWGHVHRYIMDNGERLTLRPTDRYVIQFINMMNANGARVLFLSARSPESTNETIGQLEIMGIRSPTVHCIGKIPKGGWIKMNLGSLCGGVMLVVDDVVENLFSFVQHFDENRITLLQYAFV